MKLYRGENILNGKPGRVNLFKRILRHGLPLDFINGGNPYRVQQLGLFDTTVRHVANSNLGVGPNGLKHFISFSAEKTQAEYYATSYIEGSQLIRNEYETLDEHYCVDLDSYRDERIWDYTQHLLIELKIDGAIPISTSSPFVKIIPFNDGRNRIVLLDVVSYLTVQLQRLHRTPSESLSDIQMALDYATTDSEWLVSSLDQIPAQEGVPTSFSALIAHSDILEVKHHLTGDCWST